MSSLDTDFPSDVLFWGYVAGGVEAILEPFSKGKKVHLSQRDVAFLEKAKTFVDLSLTGCQLMGAPSQLFAREMESHQAPMLLDVALKVIFSSAGKIPESKSEIESQLGDFSQVLEEIKEGRDNQLSEDKIRNTYRFFTKLAERADSESFNHSLSDVEL
ncbi:MAG: hypothetical protein ACE5JB_07025 [bacterium]